MDVALFARDGSLVELVHVESWAPGEAPEILSWESRFFLRLDDRSFIEGRVLHGWRHRAEGCRTP
jgi:hypothetical protein